MYAKYLKIGDIIRQSVSEWNTVKDIKKENDKILVSVVENDTVFSYSPNDHIEYIRLH